MAFRWVVDARGVDRRVFNLRARWRSVRVQREFSRELYEAICRTAAGNGAALGEQSPLPPTRAAKWDWSLFSLLLLMLFMLGPQNSVFVVLCALGALALLITILSRWIIALRGLRVMPALSEFGALLKGVDDGQMAAAIVVNGRCPSCVYPVDPAKPETDGAIVCPECGGAWLVVRRGGELRLGR